MGKTGRSAGLLLKSNSTCIASIYELQHLVRATIFCNGNDTAIAESARHEAYLARV